MIQTRYNRGKLGIVLILFTRMGPYIFVISPFKLRQFFVQQIDFAIKKFA